MLHEKTGGAILIVLKIKPQTQMASLRVRPQVSKIRQLTGLFMNTSSARKEGKMKPHFPRNIQQETLHPLPWSKGLLGFQFLK